MKKFYRILLAILFIAVSCQPNHNIPVSSISLNEESLTLEIGEWYTFVVTVLPENATNKRVKWDISETSVLARGAQEGQIYAQAPGTCVVTATAADNGLKASCTVTVKEKPVPVTGVSLSEESITINIGESYTLTATVSPENASEKSVAWYSSHEEVATVSKGVVTAVGAGSTTITVYTKDGKKTATCEVNVNGRKEAISGDASDITCVRAKIHGQLILDGVDLDSYEYATGVLFSTSQDVQYSNSNQVLRMTYDDAEHNFSVSLEELVPGVKYYYRSFMATDWTVKDEETIYGEIKSFSALPLPDGAVDFGLSVKWASCNDGARNPWDFGSYINFPSGIGTWRAPTAEEARELRDNCIGRVVTINGVKGALLVSTKEGYTDNPIFLPSAGRSVYDVKLKEDFYFDVGEEGIYWTCSVHPESSEYGIAFDFNTWEGNHYCYLNVHKRMIIEGTRYSVRSVVE